MKDRNFRNILIIKPSSLGDVVRCLPILHGLRWRYPQARISWLLRPDCAALLQGHPQLDEIIEFDRRRFGRILQSWTAAREFLTFLGDLHGRHFDLVLDLQGLFRSGFFTLATAAPVRLGFAHAREFAGAFYTRRVRIPYQPEHIVDSYWRFAHLLGFGHLRKDFTLPIHSHAHLSARRL